MEFLAIVLIILLFGMAITKKAETKMEEAAAKDEHSLSGFMWACIVIVVSCAMLFFIAGVLALPLVMEP